MFPQLNLDRLTKFVHDSDFKTAFRLVAGKRPRRLLAHCATFLVLFYLLLTLARRGDGHKPGSRASTSLTPSKRSTSLTKESASEVDDDVRRELQRLFKKADTTADGKLSKKELAWSISKSVEGHLLTALRNNFKNFFALDKIKKNGQVEWDEWLQDFKEKISRSGESASDRIVKEKLAAAKAAWSEAARTNPESLNIDEFLSFTHPESSHSILAQEAEDLFLRFDSNADGLIAEAEYLKDPFVEFDQAEIEERTKTFRQGLDADQNGKADKREVLTYLDPKHPFRSQEEAGRLFELADVDGDDLLDLDEMSAYADDFLESKWANPERAFHGDLAVF